MSVLLTPPFASGDEVNSRNRSQVKKWLRECGVSSSVTERLTISQLRSAIDEPEATVAELLGGAVPQQRKPQQQPQQQELPTMPEQQPQGNDQQQQINQISQMLLSLMSNQSPNVDEGRIIELIKEHAPVRSVEVSTDGRQSVKVDGAHPKLADVVAWLSAGVPVYCVGNAGSGKSSLARQAAQALDLDYYEHGAVMTRYDLAGVVSLDGDFKPSAFYNWFKHGGVLLLDELDASQPQALVQWNNAIRGAAGTLATFANGETVEKHQDALVIAAANTIGKGANRKFVGRNPLDAATLDGFAFIEVDYSDEIEQALSRGHYEWMATVQAYRKAAADHGVGHVISPRATDFGARYLDATKKPFKEVRNDLIDQAIRKGMDSDQWQTISATANNYLGA